MLVFDCIRLLFAMSSVGKSNDRERNKGAFRHMPLGMCEIVKCLLGPNAWKTHSTKGPLIAALIRLPTVNSQMEGLRG